MPSQLQTAVIKNDIQYIKQNPHQFAEQDEFGNTALMVAAKLNRTNCVIIMKQFASKLYNKNNICALFASVVQENLEAAQLLIDEADFTQFTINQYQQIGKNANLLDAAYQCKNQQIYQLIKEKFLEIHQQQINPDDLLLQIKLKNYQRLANIVKQAQMTLFQHSLQQTQILAQTQQSQLNASQHSQQQQQLTQQDLSIQKLNWQQNSLQNSAQSIQQLYKFDKQNRSILHLLAIDNVQHIDMQLLISLINDFKVDFLQQDVNKHTALHLAILYNNTNFLKILLQVVSNNTVVNDIFITLLIEYSVQQNNLDSLNLVIQYLNNYLLTKQLSNTSINQLQICLFYSSCTQNQFIFQLLLNYLNQLNVQLQTEQDIKIDLKSLNCKKQQIQQIKHILIENNYQLNDSVFIVVKQTKIFDFLVTLGDNAKLQYFQDLLNNKVTNEYIQQQCMTKAMNSTNTTQNDDYSQQQLLLKEISELVNLHKINTLKQQEENDLKVELVIQFYESKINGLHSEMQTLKSEKQLLLQIINDCVNDQSVLQQTQQFGGQNSQHMFNQHEEDQQQSLKQEDNQQNISGSDVLQHLDDIDPDILQDTYQTNQLNNIQNAVKGNLNFDNLQNKE